MVKVQLGETRFVVDRYCGTVLYRILNIVDGDVITKHRTGVLVLTGDGCTGKADKGRVGQCIAHVLGVTELVAAVLLQGGFQSVLATVRLVGDHHDVVAIIQYRMGRLLVHHGKLLHRGEDDAAGLALGQQLA